MSFFSRVREAFQHALGRITLSDQIRDEVNEQTGGDDDLKAIWEDTIAENIDNEGTLAEFTLADNGAELFNLGWVNMEGDPDDIQSAREQFFDLMEDYDISREEFDWDAWRDWYDTE